MEQATSPPPASATPILDRLSPLPAPAKPGIVPQLITFLLVAPMTFIILAWQQPILESVRTRVVSIFPEMSSSPDSLSGLILHILELAAAFLLPIVIHEVAHVIAGLRAGFSFNSLRIFSFQIDRPFRISWKSGKGTGASGWARMFPVKMDSLPQRAAAMIFAGPASNLLTGFALLLLPYSKGLPSLVFVGFSLFLGFANLVPFRSRALHSDGMRILMLLQNRARGERWVALMRLVAEMKAGVQPENYSPDFLAKAIAIRDKSPDTVTAFALAFTSADFKRDRKAAEYLETSLAYSAYAAPVMRQALMSDAGVFQARRRQRTDLAEQWLAELPQKTQLPWLGPEVRAAILEAQGNIQGALEQLDGIENLILATPNQTQREISLRFLSRWRDELQQKLANPTVTA